MLSNRFLFTLICEAVYLSGRFYVLSTEKTWFSKLLPVIILQVFLIFNNQYIYTLEFLFYLSGDYFLFFVHGLDDPMDREYFNLGIISFLVGHIIAIIDLLITPSSISGFRLSPFFYLSLIWFLAGILVGFIFSNINDSRLNLIINVYVFTITLRLTLTLYLHLFQSLTIALFCFSDVLILIDLFHYKGSNLIISNSIIISYWISLILRILNTID